LISKEPTPALDEVDAALLDILQKNGRTKRNDLAGMVGLSLPSVSDRLKKLEEGGLITEYRAILDPKRAGYDITAFIFVSVDSSKHYGSFIEHAHAAEGILECHAVTGEGTHLLKVRTANTSALEKLLAKIQSWQGVLGTRSSVVLSTSKEETRLKIHNSK
jgi:Lrp/AsnC family leucine-responsive transcriptional regulator